MRKIFILAFSIYCFAYNVDDIMKDIENHKYSNVCKTSIYNLALNNNDDGLLNLYALACLKSDYVNKLSDVIVKLRNSKEARLNAVYYSTILYKKKLLHAALVDGLDISAIKLPKCDYVLSNIYDDFVNNNYIKENDTYIFKNNDEKYEVNLKQESKITKIVVKIINSNNETIGIKEYW